MMGPMSKFMGGSAFSMARDIAEGFVITTERTYKSMSVGDMSQLSHEIERYLRELRGEAVATEETTADTAADGAAAAACAWPPRGRSRDPRGSRAASSSAACG